MNENSLASELDAQLAAASSIPPDVGSSGVLPTFDELAAPDYRAYISNEAHSDVPASLEKDGMRISVFPEGSTEPTVYLALRGRKGLMTWHKENVGISLDSPALMPIAKLLGLVTPSTSRRACPHRTVVGRGFSWVRPRAPFSHTARGACD